jgi:hypothetical protein
MFENFDRAIADAHQQVAQAIATKQTELGFPAQVVQDGELTLVRSLDPNSLLTHEGYTLVTGEVVQPNRYTEGAIAAVDASVILGATIEGTQ